VIRLVLVVHALFYEADNANADTPTFEYLIFLEGFWNFRSGTIDDVAE